MNLSPCPDCGHTQFSRRTPWKFGRAAKSGFLAGIRGMFSSDHFDFIVCQHCGAPRLFDARGNAERTNTEGLRAASNAGTRAVTGAALDSANSATDATMPEHARALLLASLAVGDDAWDEHAQLLWLEPDASVEGAHDVRATSWYALGLLSRNAPGDSGRSLAAFRRVLSRQIDAPGANWDGTFFRTANDVMPTASTAQLWKDYDPNWRQFIGTVLAMALLEFSDRIPLADQLLMEDAILRAVHGEEEQARLRHTYTNVAIMHAFLLGYAGHRLGRGQWVLAGDAMAEAIFDGFEKNKSFPEFNSPTYYGVDFFGLGLLRRYGVTARARVLGATMEAALWLDTAHFYHAGLRNLCGPFDRAYGMDMQRYASLVGVWLALVLPRELAPLPLPGSPMMHAGDFLCAPTYAILGASIPADALQHFKSFDGERLIKRKIDDGTREASAWLGDNVLIGGESTAQTRGVVYTHGQFHPATMHWQLPDGGIGWLALRQSPKVDAFAEKQLLSIRASGDSMIRIFPGHLVQLEQIASEQWELPGLTIAVSTDAKSFDVVRNNAFVEVTFREATTIRLRTTG